MTTARPSYIGFGGQGSAAHYLGFPDIAPTFVRYLAAVPSLVPAGAPLGDVPGGWSVLSTAPDTITLTSGVLPAGDVPLLYQTTSTAWTDGGGDVDPNAWLLDLVTLDGSEGWFNGDGLLPSGAYGPSAGTSLVQSPAADLSGKRIVATIYGPTFAGLLTGTFALSVYTSIVGGPLT